MRAYNISFSGYRYMYTKHVAAIPHYNNPYNPFKAIPQFIKHCKGDIVVPREAVDIIYTKAIDVEHTGDSIFGAFNKDE